MSLATTQLQTIEVELSTRGQTIEIEASLVQMIHKIAHDQGFTLAEEPPAYQAKRDLKAKSKVLYEANLAIREHPDVKRLQLQLFWYGLYVYWLPPGELSWLSGILSRAAVLSNTEYRRYCRERKRMMERPRSGALQ